MYCTVAEVRARAQSMSATGQPAAPDSLVTDLIVAASRMFDKECGVDDGYFEASDNSTTSRTFYGDGTHYLKLDPYVAGSLSTTITMPTGYTVPDYVEKDGYLILTGSDHILPASDHINPWGSWGRLGISGWPAGVGVTISGKWGFSATPADVKQAIIKWAVSLWRRTDPASLKLTNLEGDYPVDEDIPADVKRIASKWTTRTGAVFV